VSIDQGKRLADMTADVIVASVPSLGRVGTPRLLKYNPKEFKCIIIDEVCVASVLFSSFNFLTLSNLSGFWHFSRHGALYLIKSRFLRFAGLNFLCHFLVRLIMQLQIRMEEF
jgi:hypothetical protein